ncbi:response regulator transcription factor [Inquilinus sp. CAU 1745]|uniref:response regulator transcription factor n=1 Tax=Inquilinus sp. CAU 1745 TaxID=3140369 RepID=UPI00325C2ECF
MTPISLAVIDHQPFMLEGVVAHFSKDRRFDVVAQGVSGDEATGIAERHHPRLLIMDLPAPDALRAIVKIRSMARDTRVVIFTAESDDDHAINALDAGVAGYILKTSTAGELTRAIEAVARGETFIADGISGRIISALQNRALRKMEAQSKKLSAREEQIVRHLLCGRTNKEIASSLSISEKTVKHYMTVLMQKMNARNRLQVVLTAQQLAGATTSRIARTGSSYVGRLNCLISLPFVSELSSMAALV